MSETRTVCICVCSDSREWRFDAVKVPKMCMLINLKHYQTTLKLSSTWAIFNRIVKDELIYHGSTAIKMKSRTQKLAFQIIQLKCRNLLNRLFFLENQNSHQMQEILCLLLKQVDAWLLIKLLRFTDLTLGSALVCFCILLLIIPGCIVKVIYSFELFHFIWSLIQLQNAQKVTDSFWSTFV